MLFASTSEHAADPAKFSTRPLEGPENVTTTPLPLPVIRAETATGAALRGKMVTEADGIVYRVSPKRASTPPTTLIVSPPEMDCRALTGQYGVTGQ